MRARLLCRSDKLQGQDFEVTGKLTIGRSPDNSVVLASRMISGKHAEIVFDGGKKHYYLEDLESLNGTELDGISVHGRERLDRLHVITFAGGFDFIWQGAELCAGLPPLKPRDSPGESTIRTAVDQLTPSPESFEKLATGSAATDGTQADFEAFDLPSILAKAAPKTEADGSSTRPDHEAVFLPPGLGAEPAPGEPAPKDIKPVAGDGHEVDAPSGDADESTPTQGGFVLVITQGDRFRRVQLRAGQNLVGRRLGAEIHIESSEISRRHAVLTVSGSRVRLRDLGSRNHTYLNGEKIDGEVEVQPGAQVRFGVIETLLVHRE